MNLHLLAYAASTPWALMPERMSVYAAALARHYGPRGERQHGSDGARADAAADMQLLLREAFARAGDALHPDFSAVYRARDVASEPAAAAPRGSNNRSGSIAVIPVVGPMVEWASQIDICEGGTSTRAVSAMLSEAEADPAVSQILMVFNTPGGSVYGVSELGDDINRVKQSKPIYGVAQSLAASAGYWALSQCSQAYCTPGGEVGSIGVYSGHEDISKALEMAGIDITLFSSGKYKTEMSPFAPLSEEAAQYQRQRTIDYYGAFTKAVAKGRGQPIDAVRNGMGQGRVLGAEAALAEHMVDGVMPVEQVIRTMQRDARAAAAPARSALALRRRQVEAL